MTKEGKEELCTKQKMENWYVGKRGRKSVLDTHKRRFYIHTLNRGYGVLYTFV
jgi:hypothetical protein